MRCSARRIEPRDDHLLWVWANDPAERAAAGGRGLIPWEEHRAWFRQQDPDLTVIIHEDHATLGYVRADPSGCLSYGVAPEWRGMGYGSQVLACGIEALRQVRPRLRLYADVRADNLKSLACFRRLGWREEQTGTQSRFFDDRSDD